MDVRETTATLSSIAELIRDIEDGLSVSLPQYTKRSVISSRTYIQKECASQEILGDLLKVIMNMYSGFILTAVSMNQYIDKTKTVRDIMDIVATEGFSLPKDTISNFNMDVALESYFNGQKMLVDTISDLDIDATKVARDERERNTSSTSNTKFLEYPKEVNIPSGRIIELKFGSEKKSDGIHLTVNLFLQLMPIFVPKEVIAAFVNMNFTPSLKKRYLQYKTGEISFFKDFLLAMDIQKDRRKSMKADKSGILSDMIKKQENSLFDTMLKYLSVYKNKQNIANTIMIVNANDFNMVCNKYNIDFNKYRDRQSFFNKSFTMMLASIDENYNKVSIYFHGLEQYGTYTFNQIMNNAKTEKYDLTDIMKAYSKGIAPKF
jgi:hypothetical protein